MDKIIYSLVYNRKKSLNKKGMALVQVEAYLNRKKKYFSTKVYLSPDQWDFKADFYVIRHKIELLDNDLLYLQGFFIKMIVRFIFLNIVAFC